MVFNKKLFVLVLMVFAAALSRIVPHPPNFTPIISVALFSGAIILNRKIAFFLPLVAMFLSDIVLGFHNLQIVVYASIFVISVGGIFLKKSGTTFLNVSGYSIAGSVFFYLVTNFAVWASGIYSPDSIGLLSSYIMGLPFLANSLMGSLFYSGLLFGAVHFLERRKTLGFSAATR